MAVKTHRPDQAFIPTLIITTYMLYWPCTHTIIGDFWYRMTKSLIGLEIIELVLLSPMAFIKNVNNLLHTQFATYLIKHITVIVLNG